MNLSTVTETAISKVIIGQFDMDDAVEEIASFLNLSKDGVIDEIDRRAINMHISLQLEELS
jgi:hypothetical protein